MMNQRLQAPLSELHESDAFARRHIGPSAPDEAHMLRAIGQPSRQALMDALLALFDPAEVQRHALQRGAVESATGAVR